MTTQASKSILTISIYVKGNVLRNLGQNPTEAELQELVIQLDQNKNGTVEFEELLAVITNPSLLEGGPVDETEELREIFNVIDKDRNGMIGYSDLKSIIASSGYALWILFRLHSLTVIIITNASNSYTM